MSRIGKIPIVIPSGVEIDIDKDNLVTVKGPRGTLSRKFDPNLSIITKDNKVIVKRVSDSKYFRSIHGLTRTLIANMIEGVSNGYRKILVLVGMGYKAIQQGDSIALQIGFSNSILIKPVEGIQLKVEGSKVIVEGIDKQLVGQIAANIRSIKPPDPYKGKGIRYEEERPRLKLGKAGKVGKK